MSGSTVYERNRRRRALADLAERTLAVARELHRQTLAAATAKAACDLSRAYCDVAQSLRQTVALQAKLESDDRHQARDRGVETESDRRARAATEGGPSKGRAPDTSVAGPDAPKRLH